MKKRRKQHKKQNCAETSRDLEKFVCTIIVSIIGLVATLTGGAYLLGRYHMGAEKDCEHQIYLEKLEQIHREELDTKNKMIRNQDKEIYELRKENLLLRKQNTASNNSS